MVTPIYDKPSNFFIPSKIKYEKIHLAELSRMGYWHEYLDLALRWLVPGSWIAGGFLRAVIAEEKTIPGDIDIFFNNHYAFENVYDKIRGDNKYGCVNHRSVPLNRMYLDNIRAITLTSAIPKNPSASPNPPVQLIKIAWYDNPVQTIDSFDFTIVQFATDGQFLYFNPKAWEDVRNKKIHFHSFQKLKKENGELTIPSISLVNRLVKYADRGYTYDDTDPNFSLIIKEAARLLATESKETDGFFYTVEDIMGIRTRTSVSKKCVAKMWKYIVATEYGPEIFSKLFDKEWKILDE